MEIDFWTENDAAIKRMMRLSNARNYLQWNLLMEPPPFYQHRFKQI